jgi:hypothetical protein
MMALQALLPQQDLLLFLQQAVEVVADTVKMATMVALAVEVVFLEPLVLTLEAQGFLGKVTREALAVLIIVQIMT